MTGRRSNTRHHWLHRILTRVAIRGVCVNISRTGTRSSLSIGVGVFFKGGGRKLSGGTRRRHMGLLLLGGNRWVGEELHIALATVWPVGRDLRRIGNLVVLERVEVVLDVDCRALFGDTCSKEWVRGARRCRT